MILHVAPRFTPLPHGGAEKQLEKLIPKLQDLGLETAVLTWDAGNRNLLRDEVLNGIRVFRLKEFSLHWGGKRRLAGLSIGVSLLFFLITHRCSIDFVHVHAFTELAFFAKLWCRLLEIPCAAKATGYEGIKKSLRHRRGRLGQWMWEIMIDTGWTISMSNCVTKALSDLGVPDHKMVSLRNGVEIVECDVISDERLNVCAVSTLIPVKRYDILIDAAVLLSTVLPDLRWTIVGDGPLRAELEELGKKKGVSDRIKWVGRTDDVAYHLCRSSLFVHPSEYEGVSNAVLEAMAAGLPVIARQADFHQELIEDGKTGIFFNGTAEDLANKIRDMALSKDVRIKLGARAREFVLKNYSFQSVSDQYMDMLALIGVTPKNTSIHSHF